VLGLPARRGLRTTREGGRRYQAGAMRKRDSERDRETNAAHSHTSPTSSPSCGTLRGQEKESLNGGANDVEPETTEK